MSIARKISSDTKTHGLSEKMQQIVASLRLEGIVLNFESMDNLSSFDQGKISKKIIARALKRAKT